jgi:glycosyltransferase involved in cell wall biosynthesis
MAGVTYLVTIYNKGKYLRSVLAAIREQQGEFDRQYVLVDDGSTDGSGDLAAAEITDWPKACLIRQENRGPSAATNRGLAAAEMPFTHIVDADDILAPYATKLLLRAAAESGCGLVYGRSGYYWSAEEIVFPAEPTDIAVSVVEDALYTVIRRGMASSSAVLFDTAAFKAAGGCDERVFVQDQSIPQRLAGRTELGLFDHLIALGPADDPGRIMKLRAQISHDQSLTALNTLRDSVNLPPRFRRLVQKQMTGRAWKWSSREAGASMLSPYFRLFLLAHLPGVLLSDGRLETTLHAFRRHDAVRLARPVD